MFAHIALRVLFKTERGLIRMMQTLSVSEKNSASNALQLQDHTSLQNVNKEINIYETIPLIKPKTLSTSYINDSEILQELFKLNVDLYKVERNKEAYEYILQQNFDDIKQHIIFLKEINMDNVDIGKILTKNPLILKEDLNDLKVRINYLQYKRFTDNMITAIVKKNPFWLSYSTQKIDEHLGAIQKLLALKGHEVRKLATKNSKVITYPVFKLKVNVFALKEEMGFSDHEIVKIVLHRPKLIMKGRAEVVRTFDYLHNIMNIPHKRIVQECGVLGCRESRLKQRHLFLEKIGKAQYDPNKPNYVSLTSLVSETDALFCSEVAKSSVDTFNLFLKSL